MEVKKYGAIDIGSNGIRLLVSNIILDKDLPPVFQKSALVRVPIRLGSDTFSQDKISDSNIKQISKAMLAFKLLMQIHQVEKYRACATSALREASNTNEVVTQVEKESGVHIDIIDGMTEADLIASTDLYDFITTYYNYLYIDVGGGSTEFTLFSKAKLVESKSFKIGTVRYFDNREEFYRTWKLAKIWIKDHAKKYPNCTIIGTGGNINKIFKISATKMGKPLKLKYLKKQFKKLNTLSYNQRVRFMGLDLYRADVIIPALKIYIAAMKWSKTNRILVPKIGLSDGIVKTLYLMDYPLAKQ